MTIMMFWLGMSAHAAITNSGECLATSARTKTCCDAPLTEACLDAEGKALNEKLKAYQDSLVHRPGGLRDASAAARARADAMKNSAALNQHSADQCEALMQKCATSCAAVTTADAKSAGLRCQESTKVLADLREQASRDEAQAKRLRRGSK